MNNAGQVTDAVRKGNGHQGLSPSDVAERRKRFGENRIPEEQKVSVWKLLLNQVKSPLIYIILVAAAVSLIMGEMSDFTIIMVVVVTDVILGFFQEFQAQRTYVALKSLIHPTATVLRGGQREEVEIWELVPGDLVILNAGEKAPGDGTLIEAVRVAMDESILTGESEPVSKLEIEEADRDILNAEEMPADKKHCAYMGTTVVTGRGILQINRTGVKTELGQIAASLSSQKENDTPFQIRIKAFSSLLTKIVIGFTALILAVGLVMGIGFLDMVRTAIVLAIAAIPEGLLIAVTVILVLGMRKVLKRRGLVKKLLAVETLGSVTVICTDKTGTLTEGKMRVVSADLIEENHSIENMIYCNNLEGPMEIALWQYAQMRIEEDPQIRFDQAERIAEELFSSETKFMITGVTGGPFAETRKYFLKGAPEIVLSMCELDEADRTQKLREIDEWADKGLRLLGFAYKPEGLIEDRTGFIWTGLVGVEDPIRSDVLEAVKSAQHAGIQVKMITGDYRKTAERIAASIGILQGIDRTLEGDEIDALSDEELQKRVAVTDVFARIRPQQKFRIVNALNDNGEITSMIGDGVNDAPALKRADIGVVVGSATDVAKETADLILLDNDFATVVASIEEGRVIFENVKKVVAYMLSNSFAEVLTILVAMILRWPVPLLVGQILWIHLICDGPADIILGFEPSEKGIMDEKPKPLKDPILSRMGFILICVISISSAVFSLLAFNHLFSVHQNIAEGRSIVFATLAINSMIYIFAYRSLRLPLHRMNKLSANKPLIWSVALGIATILIAFLIPGLRTVLGLVPLAISEWLMVIGFAFSLLLIVEIAKAIANRHRLHNGNGH